jgi:voltage-gated potassium channel
MYAAMAILAAIGIGSVGFYFLEGWPLLTSVYTATQTVTTVGYGDHTPATTAGQTFATVFMLIGVGTVLYSLTVVAQSVIQTQLIEVLGERRKQKEMDRLSDHYIVCGAGRVGRRIIRNLTKQELPFVVIDSNPDRVERVAELSPYVISGDATIEENLRAAGVDRARGLATCLPDDADNVYTVLTARDLNPNLHIVARAVEEQAEAKLIRAGANRVVSPTIIGSQSMARALLKPAIADFMDSIVAESLELVFEEVTITDHSPLIGKSFRDTALFNYQSVIVVARRRRGCELEFQPTRDSAMEEGDLLIVVGKADSVKQLVEISR